jgi:hypothetical protein
MYKMLVSACVSILVHIHVSLSNMQYYFNWFLYTFYYTPHSITSTMQYKYLTKQANELFTQ